MKTVFTTLLAICILSVAASAATVTLYNDQTLFNAALASFQTLTFDVASYQDHSTGYTKNGVSFTQINDSLALANWNNFATGGVLAMPRGTNAILTITFSAPVTAVGFNAKMAWAGVPDSFIFTYDAVLGSLDASLTGPLQLASGWYGITSDTPFITLQIATTLADADLSGRGVIDNLQFGAAIQTTPPDPVQDTPEIATLIMIGTGLGLLRYGKKYIGPTVA